MAADSTFSGKVVEWCLKAWVNPDGASSHRPTATGALRSLHVRQAPGGRRSPSRAHQQVDCQPDHEILAGGLAFGDQQCQCRQGLRTELVVYALLLQVK